MDAKYFASVNPVVFFLHGRALDIFWLIHHPHLQVTAAQLNEALRAASTEELKFMQARTKEIVDFGMAVQKAIGVVSLQHAVAK